MICRFYEIKQSASVFDVTDVQLALSFPHLKLFKCFEHFNFPIIFRSILSTKPFCLWFCVFNGERKRKKNRVQCTRLVFRSHRQIIYSNVKFISYSFARLIMSSPQMTDSICRWISSGFCGRTTNSFGNCVIVNGGNVFVIIFVF